MEEVEAKLLIGARDRERVKSELLSLRSLGSYVLRKPSKPVVKILDVYYDTPALDLHRSSMSLRLREENGEKKITLKSKRAQADGVHIREEIEERVGPAALRRMLGLLAGRGLIPADLVESALERPADGPHQALRVCGLSPVAVVDNTRHVRDVIGDVETVAVLCLDELLLRCDKHRRRELEIEIEALSPSRADVPRDIAQQLLRRYPGCTAASKLSKYERALRLR